MSSTPDPYAEFREEETDTDASDLAHLHVLLGKLCEKQGQIEQTTEYLKQLKVEETELANHALPDHMIHMGIGSFTDSKGRTFTLKESVQASIPKDKRPEAYRWLEDNDHGGIIKRLVLVAFSKDQGEEAIALASELQEQSHEVATKLEIHPSTLKAFAAEARAEGEQLPDHLFKIHVVKSVKVTDGNK